MAVNRCNCCKCSYWLLALQRANATANATATAAAIANAAIAAEPNTHTCTCTCIHLISKHSKSLAYLFPNRLSCRCSIWISAHHTDSLLKSHAPHSHVRRPFFEKYLLCPVSRVVAAPTTVRARLSVLHFFFFANSSRRQQLNCYFAYINSSIALCERGVSPFKTMPSCQVIFFCSPILVLLYVSCRFANFCLYFS